VLALRAFVPPGGSVAYPGYGCIDLSAAAVRAGVKVRLYDLDPVTLSPDLSSLGKTISRGVDAIVVAHMFGYPADVPGVRDLASNAGVTVIEDAAQAAGGTLETVPLGALADASILSFGRGKGTTAGSGGALLFRGVASADRAARARESPAMEQAVGQVPGSTIKTLDLSHSLSQSTSRTISACLTRECVGAVNRRSRNRVDPGPARSFGRSCGRSSACWSSVIG